MIMKIIVNYDFTQQELVGKTDVFEVSEGTGLGELLCMIDAKIMEAGKNNEWIDRFHKPELY